MSLTAVNAKISAMRSQLLTVADYETMCSMGSVAEIGAYLSDRSEYVRPLAELRGIELHRGILERKLALSLFYEYERLKLHISDKENLLFVESFFKRYAMKALKALFCSAFDERSISYSASETETMISKHIQVNAERLLSSRTVPSIIEALRGTGIYNLLYGAYTNQPSLFALERQLDLYYCMQLWKSARSLKNKKNRVSAERITGTEIDLLNILWIYRLKRYYKMHNAQIFACLVPVGFRLNTSALNRMAECGDTDELSEVILSGPYSKAYPDFTNPDKSYRTSMKAAYVSESRGNPGSVVSVIGYLFDKEREVYNLTSTLEGVRYRRPSSEILRRLYL